MRKTILRQFDDNSIYEAIIQKCRKGVFLYVTYDSDKLKSVLKKAFKTFKISSMRGVYTYKGIILLVPVGKRNTHHIKYFDEEVVCQLKN